MNRRMALLRALITRDRRGNVSLEFAIIAPVMILIVLGCFELGYLMQVQAKLETAAQAMAELIAKQSSLNTSTLADICTAGNLMVAPLGPSIPEFMSITNQYTANGTHSPQQDWLLNCGGTPQAGTPSFTSPYSLTDIVPNLNDSSIIVQLAIGYSPPVHIFEAAQKKMSAHGYARPYNNKTITFQ